MEGVFQLTDASRTEGRRLLLVDDVVTTGATLESCGRALLEPEGTALSIARLCFSAD